MTNFNVGDTAVTISTNVAMNADSDGPFVDVGAKEFGFFSVLWSGADKTDATLTLEVSHTGVAGSWEAYPNSAYTLGAATGAHHWDVWLRAIPYVRFAYKKGTNTTGTFSIFMRGEVPA